MYAGKDKPDVLIVGAGPVGLITALELARRKVGVRLIEKRGGPSHTTRAFTVHARTMEMLENIGVAHRLEEVGLKCPGNIYHFAGMSEDEKPRTDFRSLPSRYAFYYKLNQNDFEQVLRDHLRATYGIVPEYGHEFVALLAGHRDGDRKATALVRDQSTSETTRVDSPWLIGADGSKSLVRTSAGIDYPGQRIGVMAMMDVELTEFAYDDSWVNYFIGESLFMLVTKLPGRFWRVYLSDAGAMTHADDARASFQAVADKLGVRMTIGEPHWATKWEISNNIAESYRRHRILLCGDASHIHSPAGGQGMNGCMQDAFNLGWKLAAVARGDAAEEILDTYEAERKPIGAQITAGAQATHEIVMAFGQRLEERIALTRDPTWQERTVRLVSGLAHNYRHTLASPAGLVQVPGPQAGDRAPDAVLRREPLTRLFHLLRDTRFTLLLVPRPDSRGDASKARTLAQWLHAEYGRGARAVCIASAQPSGFDLDHWWPDLTGEFAEAYAIGADESRAILVRPDMYVEAVSTLPEANALVLRIASWFEGGTSRRSEEGAARRRPQLEFGPHGRKE